MVSQNLKSTINRLYEELQSYPSLSKEQNDILSEKIRLEFHYNTNHIEGNTLTYGETKLYFLFDQLEGGHTMREYEEMGASDVAYKLVQELAADKERPITEAFIKNLNEVLLVRPYWKDAETPDGQLTKRQILVGDYKKHPNHVRLANGEIFRYANPDEVPFKMQELLDWYKEAETSGEYTPYELAAILHHRFVLIHPFDDGNGRISRLLVNYVLLKHNYPPVIIKSADKTNYLRALNQADVGNIAAFCEYVGEQLIWSLELCIKAANNESLDEEDDWKKKLTLLDRELAGNKEIKQKKTDDVTLGLIKENILLVMADLYEGMSVYNNYFLKITPYYESNLAIPHFLARSAADYEHIKNNFEKYTSSIYLLLHFSDFTKNHTKTFSFSIRVIFIFEDYSYKIIIEDKLIYTKLYHEKLEVAEVKKLINICGESVLNMINSKLKSVNNNNQ